MTVHTIDPIYNSESKILILGSFPSVKSREIGFFYGHPQNRFWCVLAELFSEEKPETVDDKKAFKYFSAAHECNISYALTYLGKCYLKVKGTKKDLKTA